MKIALGWIVIVLTACAAYAHGEPPASTPPKAAASPRHWQAGDDYQRIEPPVAFARADGTDVRVTEAFSYACKYCYQFQPAMHRLERMLAQKAQIAYLPIVFFDNWEPLARTFYATRLMKLNTSPDGALFDALYTTDQAWTSVSGIATYYARHGTTAEEFSRVARSAEVDAMLKEGLDRQRALGIDRTPTLVVDGVYRVPMNHDRGIGPDEMVDIVLMLVEQQAALKRAK